MPSQAQAALASHVVINEIAIDSIAGTGGSEDDWIELYNPTAQAVILDGWSIQKTPASSTSVTKQALHGTIAAGGYYLIVRNGAATDASLLAMADATTTASFSLADGNAVYLVNDNTAIVGKDDPNIVDLAGFGSATVFEGAVAAPEIPETKSIARMPDGEDSDDNSTDLIIQDTPMPQGSGLSGGNGLGGTVAITITPDASPVRNITADGADVVFQVNADGNASVSYGITSAYGSSTSAEPVSMNVSKTISLSGLLCGKTYHYSIRAENSDGSDNTDDATFATLPCGIRLDSLMMTKATAKANGKIADGWAWEFNITVWNMNEKTLKMKFDRWSGAGSLEAGGNMQFSADNGTSWKDITENSAYPTVGADISAIDVSADAGRQVKIIVRMKVPAGTTAGRYNSAYGILTE